MSILGGISRIFGIAKNVSFFCVQPKPSHNKTKFTPTGFDLSLSLSCGENLSLGLSGHATPNALQTEEVYENLPFYTPPRPRNSRTILSTIRSPRSRIKETRLRSRSMSECSAVKPYHIPPGNILRQKLKDRIQESNETPLSRKRCTSESVVLDTTLDATSHDASLVMNNPTDMFSCTQRNEDSVYDCSAKPKKYPLCSFVYP